MRLSKYLPISLFFIILYTTSSYSFDNKTVHLEINENSAKQSRLDEDLKAIGLSNGIKEFLKGANGAEKRVFEWIRQGGDDEDAGVRALNHFYDPTKPLESAGLFGQKSSSLVWAQQNDASWNVAREHYYQALTNGAGEEYATTFKVLGQLMHLISDKAVPAHVRDDAHPEVMAKWWEITHFEVWTKNNRDTLNYDGIGPNQTIFSQAVENQYAPLSALWDIDKYDTTNLSVTLEPQIGLAEYTNANFFSEDTPFSKEFPYPNYPDQDTSVEKQTKLIPDPFQQGREVAREYWVKKATANSSSYRLTGIGYLTFSEETLYIDGFEGSETLPPMDEYVFRDYADRLIPRAVGYSAALLDYFFRGRLEIQSPFFSFGPDLSITGIREFQVKNVSTLDNGQTVEKFGPGELHLVYYYTPDGAGEPVYHIVDSPVYQIDDANDPINSGYITIDTIDFDAEESVPLHIAPEEITLLLVFRGKLGNEENGVAAQTFTGITNSRIAYHRQPGGQPNTSNVYTISLDGSHPYQVTCAAEPNPWYFSPAWSRDGTKMAFENHFCTDPNPDPFCSGEHYFRNIVVIDVLSDQQYPDNVLYEINFDIGPVGVPSFSPDGSMIVAIMQNMSGFGYNANLVVFDLESGDHWIVNADDNPDLTDLGRSGPAWSPMGDKIAYYLEQQYDEESNAMKGEGDLFLVNPDGTGKIRLTDDDFKNTQPSWSPDGEWIAFSSDRDGEASMDIWLMDKNGENLRRLFDCSPASCYGPTFSPDGRKVAFSNGSSIYIVDSNGDPYSMEEIAEFELLMGDLNWSPYLVPPSMEIQAEPGIITAGGSLALSWQSSRATEIIISGIAEKQPPNGSIEVSPDLTTTYTLTAVGPTGTNEKTITVTVQ